MANKIVLIGLGNIGSRTLQSVLSCGIEDLKIWLIDPNEDSLSVAQARAAEIINNTAEIVSGSDYSILPDEADLAIISTTSGPRLEIVKSLYNYCLPKTLLLEKFLFPEVSHYAEAESLFKKFNTNVYVNCPRPAWEGYSEIADLILDKTPIDMRLTGHNWAMASNVIHFVAAFDALTGRKSTLFNGDLLHKEVIENKRGGFKDVTGTLRIESEAGDCLTVTDWGRGGGDALVHIRWDSGQTLIREAAQSQDQQLEENNWEWKNIPFKMRYASQMQPSMKALITGADCLLPKYEDIAPAHLKLIPIFNKVFFGTADETLPCPVT